MSLAKSRKLFKGPVPLDDPAPIAGTPKTGEDDPAKSPEQPVLPE